MASPSKVAGLLLGASLSLLGLFILFSGGVSLPARQPPTQFHFKGLSLLFLGLAPLVGGGGLIAIARGALPLQSKATQGGIGFCLGALGLAFLLAAKA